MQNLIKIGQTSAKIS